MFTSLLTICIPAFERYDYFEEAVLSAINQTVKCKIIVSDNGSSHEKFKVFCERHSIEYHKNASNLGIFPNWNLCMKYANTEYVLLFGDDDILAPNFVEEFLKAEQQYEGLDFYYTNIHLLTNGVNKEWDCPAVYGFFDKSVGIQEYGAKNGIGIPTISGVFKRSLMLENPWAENYYGSNDWLWIYSNLHKLKVYGNSKKLLTYRRHNKQDSINNSFITYDWSYPVIYFKIYKVLKSEQSPIAQNALLRAVEFAYRTLYLFRAKVFEYYNSLNDDNLYKHCYRNEIAKHSFPVFALSLPKLIGIPALYGYILLQKLKR